ncbi:MAG: metallophosphoesterase family protein [Promethearchaeota archaeon]
MNFKKHAAWISMLVFSAGLISGTFGFIISRSRAVLVNPRLGSPLCSTPTTGSGAPGTFLNEPLSIWVGTDPADVPVPNQWLSPSNWAVGFSYASLDNATRVDGTVIRASKDSNAFVSTGGGDSSLLTRNAVRLDVNIPASIAPGSYNLHVAFKQSLASANLTIIPGKYMGRQGTARTTFVLSEPNCVYVPWINDSRSSDPVPSSVSGYYNPWSLIHITDIHFGGDQDTRLQLPSSEVYTTPIRDAISIMAPEVVIATGDLTRNPFDVDAEYELAYRWFSSLGIPVIASNGNHDQKNLGLWPYYFGPQTSVVNWEGVKFINFNSVMLISDQTASLIAREIKSATEKHDAVFLACHIPIMDALGRQTSGSSAAIVGSMVEYGATGILQGHNHYNLVMDARKALDRYFEFGTVTQEMEDACEFTNLTGEPLPSIDGPKMIITSTAGYDGRDSIQEAWPSYIPVTGFREVVLASNQIVNYTYDMDGDGNRDPSYGQPVFDPYNSTYENELLNFTLVYDDLNLTAGGNYTIMNKLTEAIPSARAALVLPINGTYNWDVSGPVTLYERARVTNGTHEFIDIRLNIPANSSITLDLAFTPI